VDQQHRPVNGKATIVVHNNAEMNLLGGNTEENKAYISLPCQ